MFAFKPVYVRIFASGSNLEIRVWFGTTLLGSSFIKTCCSFRVKPLIWAFKNDLIHFSSKFLFPLRRELTKLKLQPGPGTNLRTLWVTYPSNIENSLYAYLVSYYWRKIVPPRTVRVVPNLHSRLKITVTGVSPVQGLFWEYGPYCSVLKRPLSY